MLRIKGIIKDVPEFKIANSELTYSGGTPGTWVEKQINSNANGFTNKTPYSGVVHYHDGSGHQGTKGFEPNEYVLVTGVGITVTHIIMKGGGEEVIGVYS